MAKFHLLFFVFNFLLNAKETNFTCIKRIGKGNRANFIFTAFNKKFIPDFRDFSRQNFIPAVCGFRTCAHAA